MQAPPRSRLLALLVPAALYLAGVALLGEWIIDDAGISFAYARNLAHGHGLVSQPGRAPVEGFSNLAWVLLLTPTFWLRLFHPVVTPKVLGALAVIGGFALLQRTLRRLTEREWPGAIAAGLLAVSPPLVIWSSSGLENGLFFFLTIALFSLAVERPGRWQTWVGAVSALLASTRPDGLVFALAGAVLVAGDVIAARREGALSRALGLHLGAFAALFGSALAYRLSTFHLLWPHPYYAKREYLSLGDRLRFFADRPSALWDKLLAFARGFAGPLGLPLLAATLAVALYLAHRRRLPHALWAALVLQVFAVGAFVVLEDDWMGEHRFATAAIAASVISAVLAAQTLLAHRPRALTWGWLALGALALVDSAPRITRFAARPPTPYADVVRRTLRFNAYAEALGLSRGSILTADVGGALMESRLVVHDAAGLCEPEVLRTLKRGTPIWHYDHPLFYDWVLSTVRPTFVTTHAFWSNVSALEQDPRFARDYVAINAHDDAYVARTYGRSVRSGDWVRREVLTDQGALARLQGIVSPPRLDPLVVRLGEALGGADEDLGALRAAALAARAAGDPHRAATLFGRALARSGDDPETLADLAGVLDAAHRVDEARGVWTRLAGVAAARGDAARSALAAARLFEAADRSPDEQRRWMDVGLDALYRARRFEEAIAAFQRVLALNHEHYGATYQLAAALDGAGRREEANRLWPRVLELAHRDADEKTASEVRARLGR